MFFAPRYSITYTPEHDGFTYVIRTGSKFLHQGWSIGSKRNAERDVREFCNARDQVHAWRPSDGAL